MQMTEILTDLSRAKQELAALSLTPDRLKLCTTVISELESTLETILTVAWIPRSLPKLQGAIAATLANIEDVEQLIVEAAGPMLIRKQAEEMVRFHIAVISLSTLRFELNVLFEAAARLIERMPRSKEVN
jgi:hypothetical protein